MNILIFAVYYGTPPKQEFKNNVYSYTHSVIKKVEVIEIETDKEFQKGDFVRHKNMTMQITERFYDCDKHCFIFNGTPIWIKD